MTLSHFLEKLWKNSSADKEEIELLDTLYRSKKAEFLAVYGRRRVGKTFLISQFFKNKGIFFEVTGSPLAGVKEQLLRFHLNFCSLFRQETDTKTPSNWSEAFHQLKEALEKIHPKEKTVIFFDELF